MAKKIYNSFIVAKQKLIATALAVCAVTAYSQNTHTFVHTGASQTISLPAGNYSIECWGADGGKGFQTNQIANGGKGGYSTGLLNLASAQTISVYVGGAGTDASGTGAGQVYAGGFNGGGNSGANNYATTTSYRAGGGGGGTDIRVGGSAFSDRVIVAGGGGGGVYSASYPGGNGGGTSGGDGGNTYHGDGGTQSAGGTANGSTGNIAGSNGAFGLGGDGGTASSKSGGGGGGGGYYGGGGGATGNSSSSQGGGGGGSGYIGGVTSGTTIMFGQTGFVSNPDVSGNGFVRIIELCSINLTASGSSNSLSPSICAGQSLTLTTDAVSNYSWSTGVTGTNQIVVSPTSNTVYALSGTSSQSCTASKSISVTVTAAAPVLTISATSNSICLGDSVSITASGALSYTYSGGISAGSYFYPTTTGNYTISGENPCGITTAFTTVTVTPLPVVAMASSTLVCAGKPTTLTAAGAGSYVWAPIPVNSASFIATPQANTVYSVTGSTGACATTATVEVQTIANPVINVSVSNTMICQGDSATIQLTGADSYTWAEPGLSGANVTVKPLTPTAYNVTGSNSSGCTSTEQIVIIVNPEPNLVAASNRTNICVGGSATLTASGAHTYSWLHSGSGNVTSVVSPTASTTYTVIGTDTVTGCSKEVQLLQSVYQATISISQGTFICPGGVALLNAGTAASYTWETLGNLQAYTVSPSATTVYTLQAIRNIAGQACNTGGTVQIGVHPAPNVAITTPRDTVCKFEKVSFSASGADFYKWSNGSTNASFTLTALNLLPFTFTVTGTDANGCKDEAAVSVLVSECTGLNEYSAQRFNVFPNPNSGSFTIDVPSALDVVIYNELGQVVKTLSAVKGNVKVEGLSKGIYLIEGKSGTVTLSQRVIVE